MLFLPMFNIFKELSLISYKRSFSDPWKFRSILVISTSGRLALPLEPTTPYHEPNGVDGTGLPQNHIALRKNLPE